MLNNDLQDAILRLKSVFEKAGNQPLVEQTGYGMSHFRLLKTISHLENPTQQEVAAELGQSQAAVSRQVKLLIDDGLIVIKVNPDNRREHQLKLSPKGKRVTHKAGKIVHQHIKDLFAGLDETTINEAVQIFNKIAEQIQKNNS